MRAGGDGLSSEQSSQEQTSQEMPTSSGDGRGKEGEETKVVEHILVKEGQRGKRKKKGWSKHKGGAKARGKQDTEMRGKVNEKVERIVTATQRLENPYDDMDFNTKKAHALFLYNDKMAEILSQNEVAFSSKSVAVKREVAKRVGVSERTVSGWLLEYWCEEEIKQSHRGKHSKCESPIEDAEFRASFCQYVRSHAKPKGTTSKIFSVPPTHMAIFSFCFPTNKYCFHS